MCAQVASQAYLTCCRDERGLQASAPSGPLHFARIRESISSLWIYR